MRARGEQEPFFPSLVLYMKWWRWGEPESLLPDRKAPGSHRIWHEWEIIHEIRKKWEIKQQKAAEKGESGTDDDDDFDPNMQQPPPLKGRYS